MTSTSTPTQPDSMLCQIIELNPTTAVTIRARHAKIYDGKSVALPVPTDQGAALIDETTGDLFFDVWPTHGPEECLFLASFEITADAVELYDTEAKSGWEGSGLLQLLAVIAQGLTGWTRPLTGMDRGNVT